MRHLISMTSVMKGWLRSDSDIQLSDRDANPAKWDIQLSDLEEGMFYFGCRREHLDGIPYEATWCNTELRRGYGHDDLLDKVKCTVHIDQVDKSLHEKLLTFLSLVESADKEGRVKWEVGNYPALRDKLAAEAEESALSDRVWIFGMWITLRDIREDLDPAWMGDRRRRFERSSWDLQEEIEKHGNL